MGSLTDRVQVLIQVVPRRFGAYWTLVRFFFPLIDFLSYKTAEPVWSGVCVDTIRLSAIVRQLCQFSILAKKNLLFSLESVVLLWLCWHLFNWFQLNIHSVFRECFCSFKLFCWCVKIVSQAILQWIFQPLLILNQQWLTCPKFVYII